MSIKFQAWGTSAQGWCMWTTECNVCKSGGGGPQ
jgi:hypothetical protein